MHSCGHGRRRSAAMRRHMQNEAGNKTIFTPNGSYGTFNGREVYQVPNIAAASPETYMEHDDGKKASSF